MASKKAKRTGTLRLEFTPKTDNTLENEYTYTGRRLDPSGLMYFRARYYDPQLGQFINRDPLEYVDGMSQYRAYFVPGATDPFGNQIGRLIQDDDDDDDEEDRKDAARSAGFNNCIKFCKLIYGPDLTSANYTKCSAQCKTKVIDFGNLNWIPVIKCSSELTFDIVAGSIYGNSNLKRTHDRLRRLYRSRNPSGGINPGGYIAIGPLGPIDTRWNSPPSRGVMDLNRTQDEAARLEEVLPEITERFKEDVQAILDNCECPKPPEREK